MSARVDKCPTCGEPIEASARVYLDSVVVYAERHVVTDLQAVEPDALPEDDDDVFFVVEEERDGMGFPRVAVYGPTRDAVIEYVRKGWGDEDASWFQEHVVDRVEGLPDGPFVRALDSSRGHLGVEVTYYCSNDCGAVEGAIYDAFGAMPRRIFLEGGDYET